MAILMLAVWWHVFYLIGMGLLTTYLLLSKISTYSDEYPDYAGTDIPINKGFQLFAFGALVGSVDYLGGIALSENKTYILNMLSFYDKTKVKTTTTTTTTVDPSGSSTFTEAKAKYSYRKKDLFSLFEIQDLWSNLFWSQRILQMVIPYIYISGLEIAIAIVVGLTYFYGIA